MKNLMILGTASHVGKSVVVAGLGRIFHQAGVKVAPFKAQNMALNSYPTPDGLEIARAQAMQAEACSTQPQVEMNPILLKPTGDKTSQVVILGRPYANMTAEEYYQFKSTAFKFIRSAFQKLKKNFELIILEGAGSPVELNLKKFDLVNLKMAKLAQANVLLVADIDRGGVFASIIGTLNLLTQAERRKIKGIIINKFRGEVKLLKPGLKLLERKTKIPVVGVIPYFNEIKIPEEDSVVLENSSPQRKRKSPKLRNATKIGIIHLPHLSNFTDFDFLFSLPGVECSYTAGSLKNFDLVIIPGTKTTVLDLIYLGRKGLAKEIVQFAQKGGMVIGICGGYQILGKEILDPDQLESKVEKIKGLGLLNVKTVLQPEKITRQVQAKLLPQNFIFSFKETLRGYEIHLGKTILEKGVEPLFKILPWGSKDEFLDGAITKNRQIFGTYLHDLLRNEIFTLKLINYLRRKKFLPPLKEEIFFNQQKEYDKLADLIKRNLDLSFIFNLVGYNKKRVV